MISYLKMMTGGHAMHEKQAILSTTVVIPYILYGACQRDPIVQVGHGEANFIFPLCNTDTFYHLYSWILRSTAVLFLFISSTFRGGEGNHAYSLVRQSTDKKKLRRRLLCCIHDRLAFDDVAARRSCGSY